MIKNCNNKSSGKILPFILIGIVILVIVVIIIAVVSSMKKTPPSETVQEETKPKEPVIELVTGDVKFKLEEVKDMGNILKGSDSKNPQWQKDLLTSDRFIKVTITAENLGKENISKGSWDLKDLFDKEDRHFFYVQSANSWILEESQCGEVLKPGFTPVPCTKIYEVANISTGLKIEVSVKSSTSSLQESFIDLVF